MQKKIFSFSVLAMLLLHMPAIPNSLQNSNQNVKNANSQKPIIDSSDIAFLEGFPALGKWMYKIENNDTIRAHWLGVKWENKNLVEPINIILVDKKSKTTDEAKSALYDNLKDAGYSDRTGHSSGYLGYIGDGFYSQFPQEKYHAFSNEIAEITNNHGRVFGPYVHNGYYIFTASFSRENYDPLSKIEHRYNSFNRARDEFSQDLDRRSDYGIIGYVTLKNFIVASTENTTGDHDGVAVVLSVDEK